MPKNSEKNPLVPEVIADEQDVLDSVIEQVKKDRAQYEA